MKGTIKTYNIYQLSSAVFMILALLWLTVSAPFVYASKQAFAKDNQTANASNIPGGTEEEAASSFGGPEEKNSKSSTSSFSEEYLHDNHSSEYFFSIASRYHNLEDAGTYIAFHGELLVPPPNVG